MTISSQGSNILSKVPRHVFSDEMRDMEIAHYLHQTDQI